MNNHIYSSTIRAIQFVILTLFFTGHLLAQWTLQITGSHFPLQSVYFINSNTGFVSSNSNNYDSLIGGEIFRTTNSGTNWNLVLFDSNFRCQGFYFPNNNTGYAVGGSYSVISFIYKTTNSGINWQNITPANIQSILYNMIYTNANTGYLGGTNGVFKTTNSGNNWNQIFFVINVPNLSWSKVVFPDDNTGYFLADSGRVYKTTNAGTNWSLIRSGNKLYFDIKFLNNSTGFISGESGSVSKTTNGGSTWVEIPTFLSSYIYSIYFANINTGYAGTHEYVMKTTNSGINWSPVFDSLPRDIISIYFLDDNTGYLACDSGKVYKTTTGGVIGIKPITILIPDKFILYQNYPNPFNPTTKIKFSVPKASIVRISVYDALGRELETLVNESLLPGTYEVNWSADRFSSGIYFYKLLTSDFSMVKKMSLIK